MDHPDDGIAHLSDLLRDFPTGMLTTVGLDGRLRSRPMASQQGGFDGDLWFFTARSSPKVDEIARQPQVCVSYAGAAGDFLSVTGVAELVDDPPRKRGLWRPSHAAWFPAGVDDPDLVLLRVRVERAEHWEHAHGAARLIAGFARIATGTPVELGAHEVIDVAP
jgi:general stress protein 26